MRRRVLALIASLAALLSLTFNFSLASPAAAWSSSPVVDVKLMANPCSRIYGGRLLYWQLGTGDESGSSSSDAIRFTRIPPGGALAAGYLTCTTRWGGLALPYVIRVITRPTSGTVYWLWV